MRAHVLPQPSLLCISRLTQVTHFHQQSNVGQENFQKATDQLQMTIVNQRSPNANALYSSMISLL